MAERDFTREAAKEDEQREVWRKWIAQRVETIHRNVTVFDVLRKNGAQFRYGDREEQISCPFHGRDEKPSARAYPESARGPSHVWCFVCNQRWDAISLWKKFSGREEFKFGALLREIESAFNIVPPETPSDSAEYVAEEDPEHIEVQHLFETCEKRLQRAKRQFDMQSFLKVCVVLDRLRLQVEERRLPLAKAKELLRQVLDKIGAKVRSCPED